MQEDIYEEIVRARREGASLALATIILRKGSTPRKDAAKMLIFEDGRQVGTIGGGCNEAEVCREALAAIRSGKAKILSFDLTDENAEESALLCGGTMEIYVEPIFPDPTVVIFGAGHIGKCIAEIATMVGFRTVVADDRIKYVNRERFPQAAALFADDWENIFKKLPVTGSTMLVIATRGHQFDLACLRFALQTPASYIGLLGSRRKTRLLYQTLEKEGVAPANFERVYAPVGIEIGSETPEEIAVSIVAELIAARKKVNIRPLKEALRLETERAS
jgi:xanthine dehydrogenase accessory factor